MDEEINSLISQKIWELNSVPKDIIVVSCRWLYTLKHCPDGLMDRYKARLIAT